MFIGGIDIVAVFHRAQELKLLLNIKDTIFTLVTRIFSSDTVICLEIFLRVFAFYKPE